MSLLNLPRPLIGALILFVCLMGPNLYVLAFKALEAEHGSYYSQVMLAIPMAFVAMMIFDRVPRPGLRVLALNKIPKEAA